MRTFALTLCTLLAGCDVIGGTHACDFRDGDDSEPRCQERNGLQGNDAFGGICSVVGATEIDGECPDFDLVVAGCKLGDLAGEVIDWYYAPMTREEVEAACEGEGTVVEP